MKARALLPKLNQFHCVCGTGYARGESNMPDREIASLRQRFDTLSLDHSRDGWQVLGQFTVHL